HQASGLDGAHSVLGVLTDAVGVGEGRQAVICGQLGASGRQIIVQDHSGLLTGEHGIGLEVRVVRARDQLVFYRPIDVGAVVCAAVHVRKVAGSAVISRI